MTFNSDIRNEKWPRYITRHKLEMKKKLHSCVCDFNFSVNVPNIQWTLEDR